MRGVLLIALVAASVACANGFILVQTECTVSVPVPPGTGIIRFRLCGAPIGDITTGQLTITSKPADYVTSPTVIVPASFPVPPFYTDVTGDSCEQRAFLVTGALGPPSSPFNVSITSFYSFQLGETLIEGIEVTQDILCTETDAGTGVPPTTNVPGTFPPTPPPPPTTAPPPTPPGATTAAPTTTLAPGATTAPPTDECKILGLGCTIFYVLVVLLVCCCCCCCVILLGGGGFFLMQQQGGGGGILGAEMEAPRPRSWAPRGEHEW